MTTEEAKKARIELEYAIRCLILSFEEESGMEVNSIYINRVDVTRFGDEHDKHTLGKVSVKISL